VVDAAIQDDGPFPHIVSLDVRGFVRVWAAKTKQCYLVGARPLPPLVALACCVPIARPLPGIAHLREAAFWEGGGGLSCTCTPRSCCVCRVSPCRDCRGGFPALLRARPNWNFDWSLCVARWSLCAARCVGVFVDQAPGGGPHDPCAAEGVGRNAAPAEGRGARKRARCLALSISLLLQPTPRTPPKQPRAGVPVFSHQHRAIARRQLYNIALCTPPTPAPRTTLSLVVCNSTMLAASPTPSLCPSIPPLAPCIRRLISDP
jgi:hypothetical protein